MDAFIKTIQLEGNENDVKPDVAKRKAAGDAGSEPQAKVQKKAQPSGDRQAATQCILAPVYCTSMAAPSTDVPKCLSSHHALGSSDEKASPMLQFGLQQHAALVLWLDCPRRPAGKAAAGTDGFLAEDDEEEDDEEDAGGSNGLPIKLSSNRRADVSEFKGTTLVNIREYYEVMPTSSFGCAPPCLSILYETAECPKSVACGLNTCLQELRVCVCMAQKDGELLPGKKGISLSPEQFNILKESAANIQTALAAEDTAYKLPLSSRYASVDAA